MDSKRLAELQAERGAKGVDSDVIEKDYETVLNECRRYIQERSEKFRDMSDTKKKENVQGLVVSYVMSLKILVQGYTTEDNKLDTSALINSLLDAITNYDILTGAMLDPDVFEIRANRRDIIVEKKGRSQILRDENGNAVRFTSPEQMDIVMRKLLGDVRLTPKDALVNARTIEGYRVAAIHPSALSPDPNDPTEDGYSAFVLRKFKKDKMELGDIVKKGTLSDDMARLCAILTNGGLSFVTVGPTASGKTTTNNAILMTAPDNIRLVILQNPSEIDARKRDAAGNVRNDVLHMEVKEMENPIPTSPTMENGMNHVLRLSPTIVSVGEARANGEFKKLVTIAQAGHPFNASYHAESVTGAVIRMLTAYLAESGNEPADLALGTICNCLNVVIVQKIMRDGIRRVIQIGEVIGPDPNNKTVPLINMLYEFKITGEPEYDEYGNVKLIKGKHVRVGKLSEKTINKLQLEGIAKRRFDFLLKDVDEANEIQEYTGEDIVGYHMREEV